MSHKTLIERCREQLDGSRAWKLLADLDAAIAQPDPWHEAILQACMSVEGCYVEADPVGSVRQLLDWHALTAQQAEPVEKRWPFADSPGAVAGLLSAALDEFDGDVVAAVRNVFIEQGVATVAPQPPATSGMPDERAAFEAATPGWDTDMTAHEAGIAWAAWQAGRAALQTRGKNESGAA